MKNMLLLAGAGLLLTQCLPREIPQTKSSQLNKILRINLNQKINLKGDNQENLGEIIFTHLDDSRCPAHAMCVRQGAAVTSFSIQAQAAEKQDTRLFIGDFMANDPGNKRNRTADTVVVQLKDKARYQLILTAVEPYPGTSTEAPVATILIKKP